MNLLQWSEHFAKIYGRNNAVYLSGLHQRLGLLIVSARTLQDVVRKNAPIETIARSLAHTTAWLYAVIGHFRELPIDYYMCFKYPFSGCGYCHYRIPCICSPEERALHGAIKGQSVESGQREWSIKEWQKHLSAVYGEGNRKRGIWFAIDRLFAEIAEVHHILAGSFIGESAIEIEQEYGLEIADVFAWIIGIGDILEVDLESVMLELYERGCPCCNSRTCSCKKFMIVDGKIVHVPSAIPIPQRLID